MTKKEAVQIMAMLGAFYGAGKANPEVMAEGWYLILEPYDFDIAYKAVLKYAENDTREYAQFPTVGNIVKKIKEQMAEEQAPITEVVRAVSYGWGYDQLSKKAQELISNGQYKDWVNMDAEKFANSADILAGTLKRKKSELKELTGEAKRG